MNRFILNFQNPSSSLILLLGDVAFYDLVLRDSLAGTETEIAKKAVTVLSGAEEKWLVPVTLPATPARYYQLETKFGAELQKVPVLAIAPTKTVISVDQLHPKSAPMMGLSLPGDSGMGLTLTLARVRR